MLGMLGMHVMWAWYLNALIHAQLCFLKNHRFFSKIVMLGVALLCIRPHPRTKKIVKVEAVDFGDEGLMGMVLGSMHITG